jgi:copper resistance protein D
VIEWVGSLARFLHDASGCALLGLLVFRLVIDPRDNDHGCPPIDWLKTAVALTVAHLLAAAAMLAVQLATVTGTAQALTDSAAWVRYALGTWFGRVWLTQAGAALVLLGVLIWRQRSASSRRSDFALPTGLAALAVAISVFAGHGAGAESARGISIQAIHVLAAGTWFGGLPVLLAWISHASRDSRESPNAVVALARFSLLATGTTVCLVLTGLATAWLQIGNIPRLLGTLYGELLLLKIVLLGAVLVIAARIRWRLLPRAKQSPVDQDWPRRLRSLLGLELLIAINLIGVASLLAGTPPAIHDQVVWPLPLRFAPDVTWTLPGVKEQVAAGSTVVLLGAAVALITMRRDEGHRLLAIAASVLAAVGLGTAMWPLTVKASRDTYRLPSVPYDAASIANGERLFGQYCTQCHGQGAMGDGPAAGGLPHPPADLTSAHVRDHTMGDMFGWISSGIAAGGMPGFAKLLGEDERWDLVNFVHTLSVGYQARILRASIVPRGPWLAAPDFALATGSGSLALQQYRGRQVVLLVLFTLPDSEPRLRALHQAMAAFTAAGLVVIAVPINPQAVLGDRASAIPDGPTPTIDASDEVVISYMLFRHTLENRRIGEVGPLARHMEFLIDRYGFLRARWLPEDEAPGWQDLNVLASQARALMSEGQVRPPPEDHLH